jgi:hypothetical protein
LERQTIGRLIVMNCEANETYNAFRLYEDAGLFLFLFEYMLIIVSLYLNIENIESFQKKKKNINQ